MPLPQMGRPKSPQEEALEALLAQQPEPGSIASGFPSPPEAPETGFGQVKPISDFFSRTPSDADRASHQQSQQALEALTRGFPDLGAVTPTPADMLDMSSLQRPSRMGTPAQADRAPTLPPGMAYRGPAAQPSTPQAAAQAQVQASRMGSPAQADRFAPGEFAAPPPPPNLAGAGPRPVDASTPPMNDWRVGMAMGDPMDIPEEKPSPFAGVTRENAMQGLAGLQAAQDTQFSPFGEMELSRLANRDPNMVAPGSNQMWAGKLQEMQGNRLQSEALQRKALEGINTAIQGTHPAVQFQQEQEARRKAMPAQITAQGQFRAAQEAADSRRDVGEANLEGRQITAEHDTINTILDVIRALRTKQVPLDDQERNQLRALENLYDQLSSGLTDTSFADAYEGIERP